MELGLCYLYNQNICGRSEPDIMNQYIIYETFSYNKIDTQQSMNRKFRFIESFQHYLKSNGDNSNVSINIIKRVELIDCDGYIVSCAIYYTYLLKIIQRKWRKILEYRKLYLSSRFINHLRKREIGCRMSICIDTGLFGLFYRHITI